MAPDEGGTSLNIRSHTKSGRRIQVLVGLVCVVAVSGVRASSWSVQPLLEGVKQIASPGVPGTLSVFGPNARAVVTDRDGSGSARPVVAAAKYGRGCVVAFGHTGYLSTAALEKADTGRLLLNAIRWTARAKRRPRVAVVGNRSLVGFLRSKNVAATVVRLDGLQPRAIDILIGPLAGANPKQIESLARFIRRGGGLITAETGWGWQEIHAEQDLATDNPGNRLLARMGLVFTAETARDTAPDGFVVQGVPSELTNAWRAFALCNEQASGRRRLSKAEAVQVTTTLTTALRSIPGSDRLLLPQLRRAVQQLARDVFPSPERPVSKTDVLAYVAVAEQARRLAKLAPEEIRAHPAATVFPGAVPGEARKVTRVVTVDTAIPRWHSTGLYAPPGRLIEVTLPAHAAGQGLKVRVGCHSDRLWGKPS
ncbi:MAG TPA: hypothetical protein EYP14_01470, partial [Planctomycetaceae bacterium]|nr:hypothetical protein [Planctomycetaceae bacterium]